MEPIVETLEVVADLDLYADGDLLGMLRRRSRQMHELVPDIVGMSVSNFDNDVTLTWEATKSELAALPPPRLHLPTDDPEGRLAQGHSGEGILDEERWQRLALTTAAAAVCSTLTLPIFEHGVVVNSVDVYAGSPHAFHGLHTEIAHVFGAWAPGAVINADLSFGTRDDAVKGPERLRVSMRIEVAVGIIAQSQQISPDAAHDELRDAARRAGVTEVEHAEIVITRDLRDDSH